MSAPGSRRLPNCTPSICPDYLTRPEAAWLEVIREGSKDDVRSPSLTQVRVLRRMIRRAARRERC